jgi:hypothetical protein
MKLGTIGAGAVAVAFGREAGRSCAIPKIAISPNAVARAILFCGRAAARRRR